MTAMETLAMLVREELQGIHAGRPPLAAAEVRLLAGDGYEVMRGRKRVTARAPDRENPGRHISLESRIFKPCSDAGWTRLLASARFWVGPRPANGRVTLREAFAAAIGMVASMKMAVGMKSAKADVTGDDLVLALKTAGWRNVPGLRWRERPDMETWIAAHRR